MYIYSHTFIRNVRTCGRAKTVKTSLKFEIFSFELFIYVRNDKVVCIEKKENQLDACISEIEMNLPIGPLDIWQVMLSSINPGSFGSSGFLNLVENLYGFRLYAPRSVLILK